MGSWIGRGAVRGTSAEPDGSRRRRHLCSPFVAAMVLSFVLLPLTPPGHIGDLSRALLLLAAWWAAARALRPFRPEIDARLERLGRSERATGELVSREEIGTLNAPSSFQRLPVVRYTTSAGTTVTATAAASGATLALTGDPVVVRYDPQEPSWFLVDSRVPDRLLVAWGASDQIARFMVFLAVVLSFFVLVPPAVGALIVAFLFAVWLVAFVLVGAKLVRRAMRRNGERIARGLVVDGVVTRVEHPDLSQPWVTFTYRTAAGEEIAARSKWATRRDVRRELALGQSVPVRYDPQEPSWVVPASVSADTMRRDGWLRFAAGVAIFTVALLIPLGGLLR